MTTTEADGGTGVLAGEERLLIDGELVGAVGGATFDVINPATEEVAGVAADGARPTSTGRSPPRAAPSTPTPGTGAMTSSFARTA